MTIFPRAVMTAHARSRLAERSAMQARELIDILDQGLCSRVSVSRKRSHLVHQLYWSGEDAGFYIAVQDVVTGDLLTVLTSEMFDAKYPGIITQARRNKVLNKAVLAGLACQSYWQPTVRVSGYVSARFSGDSGVETRTLGRWHAALPTPDVTAAGAMEQFWDWVRARLRARSWPVETLEEVGLRLPFGDDAPVPYLC